jgi:hypothetical protein
METLYHRFMGKHEKGKVRRRSNGGEKPGCLNVGGGWG